jgi:hypothetical protein
LNVPGAEVEDIYVEGTRVDRAKYEVLPNHSIIRWIPGDRPPRATASLKLTKALSLGAETDKWKRLAIILPVIATVLAAVISGSATYLSRGPVTKIGPGTAQTAASDLNQAGQTTGSGNPAYVDLIDKENQNIEIGKTYLSRFGNDYYGASPANRYEFRVPEGVHTLEFFYKLISDNPDGQPGIEIGDQNGQVWAQSGFNLENRQSKWLIPIKAGNHTLYIHPQRAYGGNNSDYIFSLSPH